MKTLKKWMNEQNRQSSIVALCIMLICIGTQQMQVTKWDWGIYEVARDSLGIFMAIILFTHYKKEDFIKYKIPYIAWTVLAVILSAIFVPIAMVERYYFEKGSNIILAIGITLMGYCIIHTFITFFIEKRRPRFYLPLFLIWITMMAWMICSESEYLWPECYFVLFLCYFLTEQTPTQHTNVMKGIVNGLVLGFIVIQGHAILVRPYDIIRYEGNFCNPNHNCLFLCFCLAGILAKIIYLAKENQTKLRKKYFLLAGICYSFIFMTMSRSGYLAMAAITIFFLIAYCNVTGKKIFIRTGLILVSLFIATMPLTYIAVRYVSAIHPYTQLWFADGYYGRVHHWEPWDSDKYVDIEEFADAFLGRFQNLADSDVSSIAETESKISESFSGFEGDNIPALTTEAEYNNPYVVRYTIYKWYLTHLSLRGMPYDEQGFQLYEGHWIQDTHNIYLDYGINFGWPAMILFIIFVWWGIVRLTRQGLRTSNPEKWAALLIILTPPIFGMFEFAWGAGMIYTVAFYLAFREIILADK